MSLIGDYTCFQILPEPLERGRKTRDFNIISRSSRDCIGEIVYYSRWRQHILAPAPGTVWSANCLASVNHFLGKLKRGEVKQ